LWPVSDRRAAHIAARIYATLTTTGQTSAADAVHAAARLTRQRLGPGTPAAWASHIHAGA
jgi:hypothetical protein